MGWRFASGRRPTSEFRLGVAAKMLWRRGGYYEIQTSQLLQATEQGQDFVDELVGGYGVGFGADAGFQFVTRPDQKTQILFGASATDIGGTRFADPKSTPQDMHLNVGIGYKRKTGFGDLSIGADLRNLGRTTAFANKTHFGADLKMPAFGVQLGMNQMNYTFGVNFDLWVVKLWVASVAEELGVANHQNTSRRYILMADFSLPI